VARFLDDPGKQALAAAIQVVEGCSSAELVICVRLRSGRYLHASLLAAMVGAFAMLAFLLYTEAAFDLFWFLVDPVLAALLCGVLTRQLPDIERALIGSRIRRTRVREAAQATFFAKGIRHTRAKTGILVYVSILERQIEVVCDTGINRAMASVPGWKTKLSEIEAIVRTGGNAKKLATALESMGPVLATQLPCDPDDINELPDEVDD